MQFSLPFRVFLVSGSRGHRPASILFAISILFALLVVPIDRAHGQIDWSNTGNTFSWFDLGGNWTGGTAPGATDTARFNANNTYEVWWGFDTASLLPAVGQLHVVEGQVVFLNKEGPLQDLLTINGSGGAGALTDFSISGASTSLTNRGLHLHSLGGGQIINGGTLTLDGSHPYGAKLTVSGGIGFQVDGNLNVQAGAEAYSSGGLIGYGAGSTGSATVTGTGSRWDSNTLLVGYATSGTLNVEAGGLVANSNDGYVGVISGSTGMATVTGSGSLWNTSRNLFLGAQAPNVDGGVGTLNVASGGRVKVGNDVGVNSGIEISSNTPGHGNLYLRHGSTISNDGLVTLGHSEGYSGSATVNASTWTNTFNMNIGLAGNGTMKVENGGQLSNTIGSIGRNANSTGTVTITGAGSTWTNSQSLFVAELGHGTLNVEAGGLVTNSFDGRLGSQSGSTGMATVKGAGSTWSSSGNIYVGLSGNGTLTVEDGGMVTDVQGYIALTSTSNSNATVTGAGSQWINSGNLFVGAFDAATDGGLGTLNMTSGSRVQVGNDLLNIGATSHMVIGSNVNGNGGFYVRNGSTVTSDGFASFIGGSVGYGGAAVVRGSGSQWTNHGSLYLGALAPLTDGGVGALLVTAGGRVQVGNDASDFGIDSEIVIGSTLANRGNLYLRNGSGVSTDGSVFVGATAGYTGSASANHSGLLISSDLFLGASSATNDGGIGMLRVNSIGRVQVGDDNFSLSSQSVSEIVIGSTEAAKGNMYVRHGSTVINDGLAAIGVSSGYTGSAQVNGSGSQWNNASSLHVGLFGNGTLDIRAGGLVSNTNGLIGSQSGSTGVATVTGNDSTWNSSGNLYLGTPNGTDAGGMGMLNVTFNGRVQVGDDGFVSGSLSHMVIGSSAGGGNVYLRNGSTITNDGTTYIGASSGTTGSASVSGNDSSWTNNVDLLVGDLGVGTLNVEAGGVVSNFRGYVGRLSTGVGSVTVTGSGSEWNNSGDLQIAAAGTGTLNIANNGLVRVGGTTTVGTNGTVNLSGGRFEFGTTDRDSFGRIGGTSGSLAGVVDVFGYHPVSSFSSDPDLNVAEVNVGNWGVLHGTGTTAMGLTNHAAGEVRTLDGEWARFSGTGNTSAGEINNYGGAIEFEHGMTNLAGGFISGRGVFVANGGWTNDGVMAFSAGFADILGDVFNSATGVIAIGGGSTTTFYDDVLMHAGNMNVDVSQDSDAVFFGSYNGGSSGLGTVHAFGDLRPGHSPAPVFFGGDLELGSGTFTQIELAGLGTGEFDQLNVAGDLFLNGILDVQLIDGFTLGQNQYFQVGNVGGTLFGEFSNFVDGALVGSFGGIDLYIDYTSGGGGGNGFAFFTNVPEPSSILVLVGVTACGINRRSRGMHLSA